MHKEDTLKTRGFLSKEAEDFRVDAKKSYHQQFAECERLSDLMMASLTECWPSDTKHEDLCSYALYVRSCRAIQAAILLCGLGMATEARAMLRLALECLFYAAALNADATVLKKMAEFDIYQGHEHVKAMTRDGQDTGMFSKEVSDNLDRAKVHLANLGPGQRYSAHHAADTANMLEEYSSFYRALSQHGAHATLVSTRDVLRVEHSPGATLVEVQYGPSGEGIKDALMLITHILLAWHKRFDVAKKDLFIEQGTY